MNLNFVVVRTIEALWIGEILVFIQSVETNLKVTLFL
jgi:hypothetical protein